MTKYRVKFRVKGVLSFVTVEASGPCNARILVRQLYGPEVTIVAVARVSEER